MEKVKITVTSPHKYSVTLTQTNALKFLKDLKAKHLKHPPQKPLKVSMQTLKSLNNATA